MDYQSFKENEKLLDQIALEVAKKYLEKKLPSSPTEIGTIARLSYKLAQEMVSEKGRLETELINQNK